MSRSTIDKIVWEYESVCLDDNGECNAEALERLSGSKPKFKTPARADRVVTPQMKAVIRDCLLDNRRKRAQGMRKLQMNMKDIHALLTSKGYQLSYPTVCNHVARISAALGADNERTKVADVFIRREHDPGMECEFDWGEITLIINGSRQKVMMAVFTLLHSNTRHAWLFMRQDTLALMEAHRNFFGAVGGVQ